MKRCAAALVLGLAVAGTGCGKKQTGFAEFHYTTQPKTPLASDYMNIAVRNTQTQVEGPEAGEYDQKKWATMTADLLQYHLQQAADEHNIPLKLVDREHMKLAMEEKDLASAGITDAGDDLGAAQLQGAKAVLTSKVTIKIDKQVGKKRTISGLSAFASAWSHGGGGGGSVDTEEVEEESRNITVQCQFQLKDAATNDIVVGYSSPPSQEFNRTKAGSFFGSSKTEADMTPRDQVIGAMIEKHAKDFLAKFVPTEETIKVEFRSSGSDACNAGVTALNNSEYDAALKHFRAAFAEDPEDHVAYFGAGVCAEKLGDMEAAMKYYKQARSYRPQEGMYAAAVERVERRA